MFGWSSQSTPIGHGTKQLLSRRLACRANTCALSRTDQVVDCRPSVSATYTVNPVFRSNRRYLGLSLTRPEISFVVCPFSDLMENSLPLPTASTQAQDE
jgi:hypothetical protein